jgi:hypothetical protein
MSDGMTDEDLTGYARIHCRTELARFHASHLRRLLGLAGMPVPRVWAQSNGFFTVYADEMDPILQAIERRKRKPRLTLVQRNKL